MRRICPLTIVMCTVFAGSTAAQTFSIQLSGDASGTVFGAYEGLDGDAMPMQLMAIPQGMPTTPQGLLGLPNVGDDLQLVEEQRAEIQERTQQIVKRFQQRRDELTKKWGKKAEESPEDFASELEKLRADRNQDLEEMVESVLLPFQRARLQQISAQAKLKESGASALQSEEFAKLLNLSDDQKKKLAECADEVQRRLMEEYRELRLKLTREAIEKILDKDQMKQLDGLLGEELAKDKPKDRGDKRETNEKK